MKQPIRTRYEMHAFETMFTAGTGTFTIAASFTKDGRAAIIITADQPGTKATAVFYQDKQGKLEYVQDIRQIRTLAADHPDLVILWESWLTDEGQKDKLQ